MELTIVAPDHAGPGKTVAVSDVVFGREYNEALVHQVVNAYLAGARAGTKAQKTRAEVRGGGIKPWKQKGTGRARAGSIRSPLWRTGGRAFAASPRDYSQKVNRKMYEAGMRSILSELVRQQRLVVTEDLHLDQPKTRDLLNQLNGLKLKNVLYVSAQVDVNMMLAARNLATVHVCLSNQISPANLIAFDHILVTVQALKQIEEVLQ
ncbi:MAG: 50S ribosomal protein L4 [Gammaproteobacteria bacterium]